MKCYRTIQRNNDTPSAEDAVGLTLYVYVQRTYYIIHQPRLKVQKYIFVPSNTYIKHEYLIRVYLYRPIYNIGTYMVICHRNATVYFFLSARPSFKCPLPPRFVCTSILYVYHIQQFSRSISPDRVTPPIDRHLSAGRTPFDGRKKTVTINGNNDKTKKAVGAYTVAM